MVKNKSYLGYLKDSIEIIKLNRKVISSVAQDKNADEKFYGAVCTNGQIFVDLWNLKDWYASEFVKAMENKLNFNKH